MIDADVVDWLGIFHRVRMPRLTRRREGGAIRQYPGYRSTVAAWILLGALLGSLGRCTAAMGAVECTIEVDSVLNPTRFGAERLVDGNRTDPESRWASARAQTVHWVCFGFARPVALDRVVVHGHRDPELALADAAIQTYAEGRWRCLASIKGNTLSAVEFRFDKTRTNSLRLYITRACRRDSTARLFEIAFYDGSRPVVVTNKAGRTASKLGKPREVRVGDSALLGAVTPFGVEALGAGKALPRTRKLVEAYYDSVLSWNAILLDRFRSLPTRPEMGYYGRGGSAENDVRPITYAAFVNAFIAETDPPGGGADVNRRSRSRREALAALRYLTHAHVTGGGACLNGKAWGDQWQSAMWARSAGMAGWILWPHMDGGLKLAVARMVEHEADRFVRARPKSSEFKDTGAEENAWNAQIVSLACNMMPNHVRSKAWDQAAKRYLYNSLSVAADRTNNRLGDDGVPVRTWVRTVNAHPDFTVENHGLVHIGYLKTTLGLMVENAVHYLVARRPRPAACLHHVPEGFDVLSSCMSWDAVPIYFGGNDWKVVHTQCVDTVIYAMLSLLTKDGLASRLEGDALGALRRIQRQEGGFYNVRRDLEFGGLCATRLIACYMAHALLQQEVAPLAEEALNCRVTGVRYLESARALLHRTPTKFASFSWGPKRMALAMPRNGTWVIWPHFSSYLGRINGEGSSSKHTRLEGIRHEIRPDGFWVVGALSRLGGKVQHAFAYASLAKDVTVYIERLSGPGGAKISDRQTGVIGHEYGFGSNERRLHGRHGSTRVVGEGGQNCVIELDTDWLNIGGRVGYVVRRMPNVPNVMRYHDRVRGAGRVPKLQEWLSLVGDRPPVSISTDPDWSCVVTFLNQSADQTATWVRRIEFSADANQAVCRIGQDVVHVDFGEMKASIREVDRGASR